MYLYPKIKQLALYFLPKADCFSFAGLSPGNEKKIYLCVLSAFAVKSLINHL
jgi:hypothetical protein